MPASQAQRKFDEQYVSSTEVMERLQCGRVRLLHLKTSGTLPDPIRIRNMLTLWERRTVEPIIRKLEQQRAVD